MTDQYILLGDESDPLQARIEPSAAMDSYQFLYNLFLLHFSAVLSVFWFILKSLQNKVIYDKGHTPNLRFIRLTNIKPNTKQKEEEYEEEDCVWLNLDRLSMKTSVPEYVLGSVSVLSRRRYSFQITKSNAICTVCTIILPPGE